LSETLGEKWFWITAVSVILIIVLPLVVIWGILTLSPEIRLIATVALIVLWGVVSGYKDWVVSRRREQTKVAEPEK